MVDLIITDHGTIWQFTPKSEDARRFLHDDCAHEGWQWLGNSLCIDHRYAPALVSLAMEMGLEVSRQ